MSWQKICCPTSANGLGVLSLNHFSLASLGNYSGIFVLKFPFEPIL